MPAPDARAPAWLTPEQVEDAIRHNSPPERFLNGTLIVALATTLQKARAALRAVEWRSCGPTYGGGYCGACGVFKEHTPGCIVGEALRDTP
jgi:3-methyladenine DNA glycosylase Tag